MTQTKLSQIDFRKKLEKSSSYTLRILKALGLWTTEAAIVNTHNTLTLLQMVTSIVIVLVDIYMAFPDLVESMKYACFFFVGLLPTVKLMNFMCRRRKIMQMYDIIVRVFWKDLGSHPDNPNIVLTYAHRGWLLVAVLTVMIFVTGSLAVLVPLATMLQEYRADLPVHRRLPVPLYTPFNINMEASPVYEMSYVGMSLLLTFNLFVIPIFDNIFFICVMNAAGHFKILKNNIKLIGTNADGSIDVQAFNTRTEKKCYADFCVCIQKHCLLLKFSEDLETIFTFQLFVQFSISSLLLCLSGLQIVTLNGNPAALLLFISYFITSILQLFLYCWACFEIADASSEVCYAAYTCGWTRASGRGWRELICLCMARAQRPSALTAGHFYPITLETFTTILSTAGSYFTLLTTVMEDTLHQ